MRPCVPRRHSADRTRDRRCPLAVDVNTSTARSGLERAVLGTNWLAMKVAPWGSRMTACRDHGASTGPASTSAPSFVGQGHGGLDVVGGEGDVPVRRRVVAVRDGRDLGDDVDEPVRRAHRLAPALSPGVSASRWSP